MTISTTFWAWPQWTALVLLCLSFLLSAASHGKPQKPFNAFGGIFRLALWLFILTAGGFFK